MTNKTARTLYIALLGMHPRDFRSSFGSEMLMVFDEASESYGSAWLLVDAAASLLRQRLLRWPDGEQLTPSADRISLMAGAYPDFRPPHLTASKLTVAFLLSLLSLTLIGPK